jgi:hypothetical protein
MTVTVLDMLRAALPAVGSFGAVYLALRLRTVAPAAAPTRNDHVTLPADGSRIELTIDRPLYGPSVIHINCYGTSAVHFEPTRESGQSAPVVSPEPSEDSDSLAWLLPL